MDGIDPLPDEIAAALGRGALVVTGNQRAARTLGLAFDRHRRLSGAPTWQPAEIVAWDAWMAGLWRRLLLDGRDSRLLLNKTQEHTLWQRIVEDDPERRSLRSTGSLAAIAADAWQRLCAYNGQQRLRGGPSPDTRAFQRWASEFQRRCRDEGLLSRAELAERLRRATDDGHLHLGISEVVLVGFDRLTPAQSALVDAIRTAGSSIEELQLTATTKSLLLVHTADELDEINAAARWARRLLEERPDARIAVIVPSLEKRRTEIGRIFREVLAPEMLNILAPESEWPFEFSLGTPLARVPLVKAALDLLRWSAGPLQLDRVSELLLSPYFAMSAGERGTRAEFDAFEVRRERRLRPEVSLNWLSAAAERSPCRQKLGSLPSALQTMRQNAATILNGRDRLSHTEWTERMRAWLKAARWEASTSSSVEFQAHKKWESALDELATLDFLGGGVRFGDALASLEQIVHRDLFAPESHDAPVQVMGAFEAAGSVFDAMWFLGVGDLNWPVPVRTNPLLSWSLQRDLGMPGTDVARDSDDARRTTERIAAGADTAVFSFAVECEEGKQRPSPALAGLRLDESDVETLAGAEPVLPVIALETVEDTAQIQTPPDCVTHGGAYLLKLQAACGFRAFAEQRLWSTELEPDEAGMDARQSGTAVHHILELFWNEVKTQHALKAMSEAERDALLDRSIERGLEEAAPSGATPWDAAYLHVQHERLRRLLRPWLELELSRSSFEVSQSEKSFDDVHVGPLRLSVRIDRIDEIDGGELLIDYKTGQVTTNAWLGERPDEPQLPLYATLSDPARLQGVAFGVVRPGKDLTLTGYCTTENALSKTRPMKEASLADQANEWRRVLDNLAEDFYAGKARVAPKKYPSTCEQCAQRILCRLDTTQFEEEQDVLTTGGGLG
ncbi:PD-(D/E)XK nuclease family protein [Edaphobacter sp.]|uniref:PD-(D/E)XK nuclease family protein n=1 Tax=Edaphobacter sp. TaxID=1934404 RepID=UPI002DBE125B|nr:PD-(D/E)XK nuclease family protein [Edaphobacter sp.]HEU5340933.1 PD-(D/E)XK nuclease family protein [Edaphobacter sp.]